jgi:hypothetical protein
VAALVTLVIGLAVITPTAGKLGGIGAAIQARGGPPTAEQAAELARLQGRMVSATQIGAVFIAIALAAMAIARYV